MAVKKERDKFGLPLVDLTEEKKEEVVKVEVPEVRELEFNDLPDMHTVVRPMSLNDANIWQNTDGELTVRFLRQGYKLFSVRCLKVADNSGIPEAWMQYIFVK